MEDAIGRGPPRDDSPPNFERIGPAVFAILLGELSVSKRAALHGFSLSAVFPAQTGRPVPIEFCDQAATLEREIHFQRFSPHKPKSHSSVGPYIPREGNSLSAVFPAQTEKSFLCRPVHTPRGKFTFSGFAREEVSVSKRAGLDGFSLSWLFPEQTGEPFPYRLVHTPRGKFTISGSARDEVSVPERAGLDGFSLSAVLPVHTAESFLCRSVHTPRGKFTFSGSPRERSPRSFNLGLPAVRDISLKP